VSTVPTVAFVVATLNEEATIEACVRSLLDQRYPADRIEVAVVDGGSADHTRELVSALAAADGRVRLLHNPAGIAASAFNIGVAATTGSLVSLVSAHSVTQPDYAAVLADAFETSGATLVGGRMDAAAEDGATATAEAIVRATSSPFGLGSARFHYSERPGWVDTAFPGAYRRDLFAIIGGFDESLVRNQDDDFHLRARLAGHPMWFDPRLRSTYRPRRTLRTLWRQYYQYGWWRAVTIRKHRRVASIRHLAPAVLVAGLASGPVIAIPRKRRGVAIGAWSGGITAWAAVLALAGWRERSAPPEVAVRLPGVVGCLHLAYGVGFWSGAAQQVIKTVRERPAPAPPAPSAANSLPSPAARRGPRLHHAHRH
jgi:succinoglycan biosynthesis protein ExoA